MMKSLNRRRVLTVAVMATLVAAGLFSLRTAQARHKNQRILVARLAPVQSASFENTKHQSNNGPSGTARLIQNDVNIFYAYGTCLPRSVKGVTITYQRAGNGNGTSADAPAEEVEKFGGEQVIGEFSVGDDATVMSHKGTIGKTRVVGGAFLLQISSLLGQNVPNLEPGDRIKVWNTNTNALLLRGTLQNSNNN